MVTRERRKGDVGSAEIGNLSPRRMSRWTSPWEERQTPVWAQGHDNPGFPHHPRQILPSKSKGPNTSGLSVITMLHWGTLTTGSCE